MNKIKNTTDGKMNIPIELLQELLNDFLDNECQINQEGGGNPSLEKDDLISSGKLPESYYKVQQLIKDQTKWENYNNMHEFKFVVVNVSGKFYVNEDCHIKFFDTEEEAWDKCGNFATVIKVKYPKHESKTDWREA